MLTLILILFLLGIAAFYLGVWRAKRESLKRERDVLCGLKVVGTSILKTQYVIAGKELEFTNRVLLLKSNDEHYEYYAHALDIEQMATGRNLNEAVENLKDTADHFFATYSKEPETYVISQAPQEFFDVYLKNS